MPALLAEREFNRGRTEVVSAPAQDSPASPLDSKGFSGGGKPPPKPPAGFFGAGGVFPGDNEFESPETPELMKAMFINVWEKGLALAASSSATREVALSSARKIYPHLENILKKTGLSDYSQTYLPLVAVAVFFKGGIPAESLPLELLIMEETFDQRKRSPRAELNLLNHLTEHGKDFLEDDELREEMIKKWTEDLFTSRA